MPAGRGRVRDHWLSSRLSTQLAQCRLARLVREHAITVVHQPMPVSPREPSIARSRGRWIGPMNGA
jgi:hypothetical protein